MRIRSTLVVLTVVLHVLMVGATAVATTDIIAFTEGETETDAEEMTEEQGSELGIVPAVEAPAESEEESDPPWTQRFLAPTVLILGVLGIAGSLIYYGSRVRGRYKVTS
jgi:hypothetical protein